MIGGLGLLTIAQAITQMENTPASLNNPGALTGDLGYCSNGKSGILVKFCTPEDGQAALEQQIRYNTNRGLNLFEFFGGKPGVYSGYAPSGHGANDPNAYANFVAANTGIDPNIPLPLAMTLSPVLGTADSNSLDNLNPWIDGSVTGDVMDLLGTPSESVGIYAIGLGVIVVAGILLAKTF